MFGYFVRFTEPQILWPSLHKHLQPVITTLRLCDKPALNQLTVMSLAGVKGVWSVVFN